MTARTFPLLLAWLALLASSPGPPDRDEDAYRAFVRSSQGAALLAEAREAMSAHWASTPPVEKEAPAEIPWPAAPRGVYLSLTDGSTTHACVGSVSPYRGNLVATVRALAVQSLQADRRHPPIRRDQMQSLQLVISFAGAVEPVADPMQVDPGREGLLVSSAGGSVAFLPGEARTVAWALTEARRIGVLKGPSESARYSRFAVVVLAEPLPERSPMEESHESP